MAKLRGDNDRRKARRMRKNLTGLLIIGDLVFWVLWPTPPAHIGEFESRQTVAAVPPKPHEWTVERQKKNRKQRRQECRG